MGRVGDALARRPVLVDWLILAIAVALPCRYLWPLHSDYYIDWRNQEWATQYFAEFFRHHGSMPTVLSTPELAGLPAPVFYGNLMFPVLGGIARLSSAAIAMRIAAVVLYATQYRLIQRALVSLCAPVYLARAVACLVIWAIYPLTNLFNRGALTEFVATALLVCAVALLAQVCTATEVGARRRAASAMMLCLTISAGTHPITAMLGIPVFAVVAGTCWWLLRDDRPRRRASLRAIAPWIVVAAVCLAPFVYAMASYSSHLAIRQTTAHIDYYPGIDEWATRFWPLPLDPRVHPGPLTVVSTPYLDAQINLPLLLVFVLMCGVVAVASRTERGRGRGGVGFAIAISVGLFVGFTLLSLWPATVALLPGIASMMQFAYRAVTYQNLALIAGILLVMMAAPAIAPRLAPRGVRAIIVACLALSAVAVVAKWRHIAAVKRPPSLVAPIHLPADYYGGPDYSTPDLFAPLESNVAVQPARFEVDEGARFGLANVLHVDLAAPTWLATNVLAFPWNTIEVDGDELAATELCVADHKLVVHVPAGTHKLGYHVAAPLIWRVLRIASLVALFGWIVQVVAAGAIAAWRRRRRSPATLST